MTDLENRKDKAAEWLRRLREIEELEREHDRTRPVFEFIDSDGETNWFEPTRRGGVCFRTGELARDEALRLAAWIIETFAEPGKDGG